MKELDELGSNISTVNRQEYKRFMYFFQFGRHSGKRGFVVRPDFLRRSFADFSTCTIDFTL